MILSSWMVAWMIFYCLCSTAAIAGILYLAYDARPDMVALFSCLLFVIAMLSYTHLSLICARALSCVEDVVTLGSQDATRA